MAHGSKPKQAPVSREELERAIRHLNAQVASMRDEILTLGAQVVTLTRQLERRGAVSEEEVLDELPTTLAEVRLADADPDSLRAVLGPCDADKYQQESPPVPCEELLPICRARCCRLGFPLATQDLNECVARWDYVRPYAILHRKGDGRCVHNQPKSYRCGIYEHRPQPCRTFDCREDPRIWDDFENRVLAPESAIYDHADMAPADSEVARSARADRTRQRGSAWAYERLCLVGLRGVDDDPDTD